MEPVLTYVGVLPHEARDVAVLGTAVVVVVAALRDGRDFDDLMTSVGLIGMPGRRRHNRRMIVSAVSHGEEIL